MLVQPGIPDTAWQTSSPKASPARAKARLSCTCMHTTRRAGSSMTMPRISTPASSRASVRASTASSTRPYLSRPQGTRPRRCALAPSKHWARRGLLEWAVVDPGSVNIGGQVYLDPDHHVRHGLALAARHRFHPGYAIYEAGFVRLGAELARVHAGSAAAGVSADVLGPQYQLRISAARVRARGVLAAAPRGVRAARAVDAGRPGRRHPAPRRRAGVARGGHLRVGLEDARLGSAQS